MKTFLLVFGGGGMGSVLRYYLGKWIQSSVSFHFPISTLIINVLASFVLGFLVGKTVWFSQESWRAFVAVGFCGGFSTFSTFSNENVQMILAGKITESGFYMLSSVFGCLIATYVGIWAGKTF